MFENSLDLGFLYGREPFHELVNRSTIPQVFEEGIDRHSSAPEDPSPTEFLRVTFDSITFLPVSH